MGLDEGRRVYRIRPSNWGNAVHGFFAAPLLIRGSGVRIPPGAPSSVVFRVKSRYLCLTLASVPVSHSATRLRFLGDSGLGTR